MKAVYPGMSVRQISAEGTYIFNGDRFSAKASFEQSEKQLRSAGSLLIGGGAYLYRVAMMKNTPDADSSSFDNFQLGVNLGYAYSWVIDEHCCCPVRLP